MKKILFASRTSICCLLAMFLIFVNVKTVAQAVESEEQVAGATVAVLEISSYEIAEGVVEAGKDVKINLNLHNASSWSSANNTIITVTSNSGMIYPSFGEDNQVYVGTIGATKTATATIPVTISPSFTGTAIDLICTIVCESRGIRLTNTATIVLPTSNGSALSVKSVDVSSKATVFGKSLLSVNFTNNSADTINDAKLIISGNVDTNSQIIDLGAISAAKTYLKDYYITFVQTGVQTIGVVLAYSDANGEIINTDLGTYSVSVEEEGASSTDNTQESELMLWGGRAVTAVAFVCALVAVLVYIKKR